MATKAYYIANRKTILQKSKLYQAANVNRIKAQRKQYRIENAAAIREADRIWKLKNADSIKERARIRYRKHVEAYRKEGRLRYQREKAKIIARVRRYYRANRFKIVEYKRRWKRNNKDRMRIAAMVYRRKYPHKALALQAVFRAVRDGRLIRPKHCCQCRKEAKTQGHHHAGYAKENRLNVTWLCPMCHVLTHRQTSVAKSPP